MTIICLGNHTLSYYAKRYKVSVSEIYNANSSIKKQLISYNKKSRKIPKGTPLVIPDKDKNKPKYSLMSVSSVNSSIKSINDATMGVPPKNSRIRVSNPTRNVRPRSFNNLLNPRNKHFTSFFYRIKDGVPQTPCQLPVIPEEFSESNSANFNSVSMMGRSVDYQIYEGSSRSVSFSLRLHEELYVSTSSKYENIHNIVSLIESCCYPIYDRAAYNYAAPPEIAFQIGKQFYIRGILTNCSATWHTPIIDDQFVWCDLSIGITETTGPYSMDEISNNSGRSGLHSFRK